ncbi:hypothetical protein ACLOJK_007325 [Asimina triloba]
MTDKGPPSIGFWLLSVRADDNCWSASFDFKNGPPFDRSDLGGPWTCTVRDWGRGRMGFSKTLLSPSFHGAVVTVLTSCCCHCLRVIAVLPRVVAVGGEMKPPPSIEVETHLLLVIAID